MSLWRRLLLALVTATAGACGSPEADEPLGTERGAEAAGATTVCWHDLRQRITGFGASSAWTAPNITDELADQLFSLDHIGLSLLRVHIAPNGTTSETATAQKAQARGATVWAAPWSPPGAWKSNGSDVNGGALLPANYQAWAGRLALFVRDREAEGIHIAMLSAQNEPDFRAAWETCEWSPADLVTFVRDALVPALARQGVSPELLAPESSGWNSIARYADPLLQDPASAQAIGVVATHSYNGSPYPYASPARAGKELWMTEWSEDETDFADPGMTSALAVARAIHDNVSGAEVNAWHYWWLVDKNPPDQSTSNAALVRDGVVTRRAFVTGQYSRFVRPGSTRIRVSSPGPQPGVQVSAFVSVDGAGLVLVAINSNDTPVTQGFTLAGAEVGELTPWVTNDDVALEPQAPVPGGAQPSYELSARSVTTLVGALTVDPNAPASEACSPLAPRELSEVSGCSCREAGRAGSKAWSLLTLLALASLVRRRLRDQRPPISTRNGRQTDLPRLPRQPSGRANPSHSPRRPYIVPIVTISVVAGKSASLPPSLRTLSEPLSVISITTSSAIVACSCERMPTSTPVRPATTPGTHGLMSASRSE